MKRAAVWLPCTGISHSLAPCSSTHNHACCHEAAQCTLAPAPAPAAFKLMNTQPSLPHPPLAEHTALNATPTSRCRAYNEAVLMRGEAEPKVNFGLGDISFAVSPPVYIGPPCITPVARFKLLSAIEVRRVVAWLLMGQPGSCMTRES
jgi:hypothetical protein